MQGPERPRDLKSWPDTNTTRAMRIRKARAGGPTVNRRKFMLNCATAAAVKYRQLWGWSPEVASAQAGRPGLDESAVGQPANLAMLGELNCWINPDATPHLRDAFSGTRKL